jgi:arylsulfatase A-like enzyme
MSHNDVDHTTATHFPLTGREIPTRGGPRTDDWPNYGAVLARLGRGKGPLPPYVSMMPVAHEGAPRFVEESHGQDAGWLGSIYHPMRIDADASKPDYHPAEFSLQADIPQSRTDRRRELLQSLERQTRQLEQHPQMVAANAHYDRAFSLLGSSSAAEAFDLSKEDQRLRERYGMNIHGQAVLQARRLVEAGVPLVTVFWQNDGITNVSVYWDTHARNFIDLKTRLCPVTDQAFAALLDDLEARGLLDETLIVWTGEMGRTPKVGQSVVGGAGAAKDGRDHWPHVFTTVLAGGGVKGGIVHGASDRFAAYPADKPTKPADLAATIYHCLGVDPKMRIDDRLGRTQTLCEGEPIEAILS